MIIFIKGGEKKATIPEKYMSKKKEKKKSNTEICIEEWTFRGIHNLGVENTVSKSILGSRTGIFFWKTKIKLQGLPWWSSGVRLHASNSGGLVSIPNPRTGSHMPQLRVHMPKLEAPACCN